MANEYARDLRKNQTEAEKKWWRYLRLLRADGFHFRRQVPIDHYIVDSACFSARLVIELDGGQHNVETDRNRDVERDARLQRNGFTVLRFWNNDVMANPEGVMEVVRRNLEQELPNAPPRLTSFADPPRRRGG